MLFVERVETDVWTLNDYIDAIEFCDGVVFLAEFSGISLFILIYLL